MVKKPRHRLSRRTQDHHHPTRCSSPPLLCLLFALIAVQTGLYLPFHRHEKAELSRSLELVGSVYYPEPTAINRQSLSPTILSSLNAPDDVAPDHNGSEAGSSNSSSSITRDLSAKVNMFFDHSLPPLDLLSILDFNQTLGCGGRKCAFASTLDPEIVILVGQDEHVTKLIQAGIAGWEWAERLERDYGARHLMLGPATGTYCTPQIRDALNRDQDRFKYHTPFVQGRGKLFVQPTRIVPANSLLFGCCRTWKQVAKNRAKSFLWKIRSLGHKREFLANMGRNLNETVELLRKEPTLVYDFQVYIDTHGTVYHFDLDRVYEPNKRNIRRTKDTCPQSFREFVDSLMQELLEEDSLPNTTAII